MFSRPKEFIMAPFAGNASSTTAVAAMMLNRKWIGSEANEEIFPAAQGRFYQWVLAREAQGSVIGQYKWVYANERKTDFGAGAWLSLGSSNVDQLGTLDAMLKATFSF